MSKFIKIIRKEDKDKFLLTSYYGELFNSDIIVRIMPFEVKHEYKTRKKQPDGKTKTIKGTYSEYYITFFFKNGEEITESLGRTYLNLLNRIRELELILG